jgi:hypothetical protein
MKRIYRPVVQDYTVTPETVPDVDAMTEDALRVLSQELTRYKVKSLNGTGLDEKEARTLQGYIRSLMDIRKEEREAEKTDAALDMFKNMSHEEVLAEAAKLLAKPSSK